MYKSNCANKGSKQLWLVCHIYLFARKGGKQPRRKQACWTHQHKILKGNAIYQIISQCHISNTGSGTISFTNILIQIRRLAVNQSVSHICLINGFPCRLHRSFISPTSSGKQCESNTNCLPVDHVKATGSPQKQHESHTDWPWLC